ncbi:MAG: class I SAM-dependent methyltransferase [Roseiflexaceae bacterium]
MVEILSADLFYTHVAAYMQQLDPTWDNGDWRTHIATEQAVLVDVLGPANGRSILDASCGTGRQALALATLGWQVTAVDYTPAAVRIAQDRARQLDLHVTFQVGDMRQLSTSVPRNFDWAISCMALDNLLQDAEIQTAITELWQVLRPTGRCYIRLRDFDHLLATRPRYELREERALPTGRVLRLEDWIYESDTHVTCIYVFLHEDQRKTGYRWETTAFGYRRRALQKAELARMLRTAGFTDIAFLPQPSPWSPYAVTATKIENEE